jgi:hypothetical protein
VSSRRTGLARGELGVLEDPMVERRNSSFTKRRRDELGSHGVFPNSHGLVDEVVLWGKVHNFFTSVEPRSLGGLRTSEILSMCLMCGVGWKLEDLDVVGCGKVDEAVGHVRSMAIKDEDGCQGV